MQFKSTYQSIAQRRGINLNGAPVQPAPSMTAARPSPTVEEYMARARGDYNYRPRSFYAGVAGLALLVLIVLLPMAASIVRDWHAQYIAMKNAPPVITEPVYIEDVQPGHEYNVDGLVFAASASLTNPSIHTLADGRRCGIAGATLQEIAANIHTGNFIRCEEGNQ